MNEYGDRVDRYLEISTHRKARPWLGGFGLGGGMILSSAGLK
jgi:hypothetical protein